MAKFGVRIKKPKFGTKNAYFGYFWGETSKNYNHICAQHIWICQKYVLKSYSELRLGSIFPKVQGSVFSEGPDAGSGLLCKVYHSKLLIHKRYFRIMKHFNFIDIISMWKAHPKYSRNSFGQFTIELSYFMVYICSGFNFLILTLSHIFGTLSW